MKHIAKTAVIALCMTVATATYASQGDRETTSEWETVIKTTAQQDEEYKQPKHLWERDHEHDKPRASHQAPV